MRNTYSTHAPKKATNLSLNSELLAEAKRLNINLSATMEKGFGKGSKTTIESRMVRTKCRSY